MLKPPHPHAIVIGLDSMTGLQSARILARRGVPVIAIARDPAHPCCRTNVCERILVADWSSEELIATLVGLDEFREKPVLFPCSDMSVLLISRHRSQLEDRFHVVLPEASVVEMLMDKIGFCTFAAKESLAIPGTRFLRDRTQAEAAASELGFPCILKPPMKTPRWESQTKAKVFKVSTPQELLELYDRCADWAEILMVQEWVEGTDADLYSCNCYFNARSEPLVTFIARKIRQWPPETGTSCLGEECRNDEVLEESIRLFRRVGYRGLGYVEMKRDRRTGKHYIIEPNIGRPTGRSAIAEAGGVELLYTKYCDVVGLPLPEGRVQKYGGAKWIYLRRDLQSALWYWRRGRLTAAEWWRSLRGRKAYAILSIRDPAPFCHDWLRLLSRARTHRRRGRSTRGQAGDAASPRNRRHRSGSSAA